MSSSSFWNLFEGFRYGCTCYTMPRALSPEPITCRVCLANGHIRTPSPLHPALEHGSVICYDVKMKWFVICYDVKMKWFVDDHTVGSVTTEDRKEWIKLPGDLYMFDGPRLAPCYLLTLEKRTELAIASAKLVHDFIPSRDLLWTILGEYVHGIIADRDNDASMELATQQPFSSILVELWTKQFHAKIREAQINALSSVERHMYHWGRVTEHYLRVYARKKQEAHQNHVKDVVNETSRCAVAPVVFDNNAVVDETHVQCASAPAAAIDNNAIEIKFIDVQDKEHEQLDLVFPLPQPAERLPIHKWSPLLDTPGGLPVTCSNMDDVDIDAVDFNGPATTQEVSFAYAPPSSPVSDRQRELDAQDDAYVEHVLPRIERLNRVHAERMRAINKIGRHVTFAQ